MGIFDNGFPCNDPTCRLCQPSRLADYPPNSGYPFTLRFETAPVYAQVKSAPAKPAATPAVVAGLDPREKMKTINELHGSDILSRAESRYLLGIDEPAYVREVVARSVAQRGLDETIAQLPPDVVAAIEKQIRARLTKALAGA